MKASILFAAGLVLAASAVVGAGSAQAGEGGAAGSVAIQFGNNTGSGIADISSAISVGKNGAGTTARTVNTPAAGAAAAVNDTFASAIGAGAGLTASNVNNTTAGFAAAADDATGLGANQVNSFVGGGQSTLKGVAGTAPGAQVLPAVTLP